MMVKFCENSQKKLRLGLRGIVESERRKCYGFSLMGSWGEFTR
jgi:hypothetical protein